MIRITVVSSVSSRSGMMEFHNSREGDEREAPVQSKAVSALSLMYNLYLENINTRANTHKSLAGCGIVNRYL